MRRNAFDSRRDMLLRASKFVIEDLNSTAIDLNRLLESEKSQMLWSKYPKGDCGNIRPWDSLGGGAHCAIGNQR